MQLASPQTRRPVCQLALVPGQVLVPGEGASRGPLPRELEEAVSNCFLARAGRWPCARTAAGWPVGLYPAGHGEATCSPGAGREHQAVPSEPWLGAQPRGQLRAPARLQPERLGRGSGRRQQTSKNPDSWLRRSLITPLRASVSPPIEWAASIPLEATPHLSSGHWCLSKRGGWVLGHS